MLIKFKKYFISFLFGAVGGLAFPPLYLLFFLPFSFCYLFEIIINEKKNKSLFFYSLVFGFGFYLTQFYWISFSLMIDIKKYFILFPFAITLIPFACAFYFCIAPMLTKYLINKFNIGNKFFITILFSLFFVFSEFLRGLIFPWSMFSYIFGFSDVLIQFLSLTNIYIFNFIVISFFCFYFVLFKYENKKLSFVNKFYSIYYVFILIFLISFGVFRLHNAMPKKINKTFRLVQANIAQTLKWDEEQVNSILKKHINLSIKNANNIDIIIWSESSIPYLLTTKIKLNQIFHELGNKVLISGVVRGEYENNELNKVWNSVFIFKNNELVDYYDKNMLVPFGEYIPFSKYIPFITKITNGAIDFSKGTGNKTIEIDEIKISPVICYEITFPNKIFDKKNRPDLIINLTNDGWFGNSSGPYQHLISAKFRAVENKIPIIRVSNSGISAYINEYGIIEKKTTLNKTGMLDLFL